MSQKKAVPTVVRELTIQNRYGIHARPAALFVKTASRFQADVTIEKDRVKVSGKSIMGLMTLVAGYGSTVRLTTEGPDAEEAMDALAKLIEQKFFEE
jgi:phosphocarrier protein